MDAELCRSRSKGKFSPMLFRDLADVHFVWLANYKATKPGSVDCD
ncbi:hypothetical protein CEV33_2200 [Brucella grignonensis]|uniref:Uncharacterized protein n=1 Tax=Brucella grignonensis TaxID=94627 RepID=A0A256F799_9HYPH|nr:hypothetical protein CEV33_2200 [Brucella grignonensis]